MYLPVGSDSRHAVRVLRVGGAHGQRRAAVMGSEGLEWRAGAFSERYARTAAFLLAVGAAGAGRARDVPPGFGVHQR